jgi:hypothetical protein
MILGNKFIASSIGGASQHQGLSVLPGIKEEGDIEQYMYTDEQKSL